MDRWDGRVVSVGNVSWHQWLEWSYLVNSMSRAEAWGQSLKKLSTLKMWERLNERWVDEKALGESCYCLRSQKRCFQDKWRDLHYGHIDRSRKTKSKMIPQLWQIEVSWWPKVEAIDYESRDNITGHWINGWVFVTWSQGTDLRNPGLWMLVLDKSIRQNGYLVKQRAAKILYCLFICT